MNPSTGDDMENSLHKSLRKQKRKGFREGWIRGYHLGACEAVRRMASPERQSPLERRVLFIRQGFPAIDSGVADALTGLVRETIVGTPYETRALAGQYRPDLVLVMNGIHSFPPEHSEAILRIREQGIRTAVWFADDPYFSDDSAGIAGHYDYVFTHERGCVPFYRELGCGEVHYLPLAVHPGLYRPMAVERSYHSDICFIGTAFPNRIRLIDRLARFLSGRKVILIGALWHRLRRRDLLSSALRAEWVPPGEAAKYYSGAKIVINHHRDPFHAAHNRNSRNLPAESINPRTFEISACGTLQLTDIRGDLLDHYTPGLQLDTYASAAELRERLEHYLHREEERRLLALRGLRRTLRDHTYSRRLKQLLDIIFPSG
jgi:spore maturation protein CgeB